MDSPASPTSLAIDQGALAEFLGHHRKFWKLISIQLIATMILYFLVIIAAFALPIFQKLQRS